MTRSTLALLSALLVATPCAADVEASPVLVQYDFDGDWVETGPWLIVWQDARGSVTLNESYRFSGQRSVQITDVAEDGEFAELQGFFPLLASGKIFAHFALMVADPSEAFNVALAGPEHFRLSKDGMGFWLKGENGALHHVTAQTTKRLLELRPFTWYVLDLGYDIEHGVYDLTIAIEGRDEPVLALTAQPNAVGLPGSTIHKFSFIGDPPGQDGSNVTFYVDDIVISTDQPVSQSPFVAPGRRMLFIDQYDHYRARLYDQPECPPVLDHEDFGITDREPTRLSTLRDAIDVWRQGCVAPRGCKTPCALELFRQAASMVPEGKIYPMSAVLALVAEDRFREADELFFSIRPDWLRDPRFPSISATLGIARGDLAEAESWLRASLEDVADKLDDPSIRRLWSGAIDHGVVVELKAAHPADWAELIAAALTSEQRYYVLLWQGDHAAAESYAARMARRFRRLELPTGTWLERQGDAAFYTGDYASARKLYERSLAQSVDPTSALLKLSDVHFKLGNLDLERQYRERIYGTLDSSEAR